MSLCSAASFGAVRISEVKHTDLFYTANILPHGLQHKNSLRCSGITLGKNRFKEPTPELIHAIIILAKPTSLLLLNDVIEAFPMLQQPLL